MSLVYVGDVTFQETENSGQLGVDLWGADALKREWEGSKVLLATFLSKFKLTMTGFINGQTVNIDRSRQIQDHQFRDLWMTGANISNGRAFSKVSAAFTGVFNGRKPQPVIEYGVKAQQVTLPYIGDQFAQTNGLSASFTYMAPFTTYRYLTKQRPNGPIFKGKLQPVNDAIQIVTRTGAVGDVKFFKGRTLTGNSGVASSQAIIGNVNAYNAVVECITQEFSVRPQGAWFAVSETNQATLTPLDLANSGWVYQL